LTADIGHDCAGTTCGLTTWLSSSVSRW